ncbi:MAG TPA: hypothetical protein VF879_00805 [Nitrospirales bacterium]
MTNKRRALIALIVIALTCILIALLVENRANKKYTRAVQEFADNMRALSISMNVGDKAFLKVSSYGATEVVFLDPYENLKGVLPEFSDNAIQELYDISNSDYGFALVWVNNGRIQHKGYALHSSFGLGCPSDRHRLGSHEPVRGGGPSCRPPPVRTGSSSTPEAPPEREMAKGAAECAPVPGWRRRNWSQRHTPFQHYGTAVLNLTCYMDGELGRAPAKIGGVQVAVVKLRRENGNIALRLSF